MPESNGPTYQIPKTYARSTLRTIQQYGALGLHIRCIKCGHSTPWPFPWLAKSYPNVMDEFLEHFAARMRCRVCHSPRIAVRPYKKLPVDIWEDG